MLIREAVTSAAGTLGRIELAGVKTNVPKPPSARSASATSRDLQRMSDSRMVVPSVFFCQALVDQARLREWPRRFALASLCGTVLLIPRPHRPILTDASAYFLSSPAEARLNDKVRVCVVEFG